MFRTHCLQQWNQLADIEVEVDPGVCEIKIDYPIPVTSDNCNVSLEQTEGLGVDGMFPLGVTTETWVVSDPVEIQIPLRLRSLF